MWMKLASIGITLQCSRILPHTWFCSWTWLVGSCFRHAMCHHVSGSRLGSMSICSAVGWQCLGSGHTWRTLSTHVPSDWEVSDWLSSVSQELPAHLSGEVPILLISSPISCMQGTWSWEILPWNSMSTVIWVWGACSFNEEQWFLP